MEFKTGEIAIFLGGIIEGDSSLTISSICEIDKGKKNGLSFLANEKYVQHIYNTNAGAVIVSNKFKPTQKITATLIKVDDPYQCFAKVLAKFDPSQYEVLEGIDTQTHIDKTVEIGEKVYIGSFSFLGKNVKIGNNVKIHPQVFIGNNVTIDDNTIINTGVKIYYNSVIGKNCIIHAGTVLGADGFGFAQTDANYVKVAQVGNVIIEDNVEIGANCCIDRGTIGSTIIRKGAKLDNLIQIAHNIEIGENCAIAAQVGMAGSAKIGKNVQMGGQVGVAGHITVADNVKVGAQSGIASSVKKEGEILLGSPAYSYTEYKRAYILFKRLPDIHQKIIALEKQLKELKESSLI